MASESASDEISLRPNQFLFHEGDACRFIYLIKEGRILSVKEGYQNRLVPIAIYKEKDFVGVDALCDDHKHSSYALAMEKTTLIRISIKDISELISGSPIWVDHLITILSERFRGGCKILAEQHLINVEDNFWNDKEEIRIRKLIKEKS